MRKRSTQYTTVSLLVPCERCPADVRLYDSIIELYAELTCNKRVAGTARSAHTE